MTRPRHDTRLSPYGVGGAGLKALKGFERVVAPQTPEGDIVACLFMMTRHGGIYHGKIPQFCQGAATCHISDMPQHHTSNQREISFYIFFHYIR